MATTKQAGSTVDDKLSYTVVSGLYIYIPFCVRKCGYCTFYVETPGTGPVSKRLRDHHRADNARLIRALDRELSQLPGTFAPDTVYCGGGTPTELSMKDLTTLFESVRAHINLEDVVEWSCESNPGTLTEEKAQLLLDQGVTRVSLGVQTFDPEALEFLGRIHTSDEAQEGVRRLREVGAENINIDLLFNIPNTSLDLLKRDLEVAVDLGVDHLSCYPLDFEEGSAFTDLRDRGYMREMEDEAAADQYEIVCEWLKQSGFEQYELFSFAREGKRCLHHLNYWDGGDYYGCGPAAHSHIDGVRWSNIAHLNAYCAQVEAGALERVDEEKLDAESKARELLILGLRRTEGVSRTSFKRATGYDVSKLAADAIEKHVDLGLLEEQGDQLRLADRGRFVCSSIFSDLL